MIKIYTTPSCSSCRKAKKWMNDHQLDYKEINIFNTKITNDDLNLILQNTENGVEDIVSTRSRIFKENNLDVLDMTLNQLKSFIIDNPSVLRRPIIVGEDRMQVGYNDDDIRVFIPKELRELARCSQCSENCEYKNILEKYLKDLKKV